MECWLRLPGGGGDCGGSFGWDCEDSPGSEVLASLGGGGLAVGKEDL